MQRFRFLHDNVSTKSCEFCKNVYVCFIDFDNAFDQINYTNNNQTSTVNVADDITEILPTRRGFMQVLVLLILTPKV